LGIANAAMAKTASAPITLMECFIPNAFDL